MTEVTAEAAHDAKLPPDSSSDRDKRDSGKDVGRYAASLTEIENEAVEPKVPADMVSIIDKLHKKHRDRMPTYTARALDRLLRTLTRTPRRPPPAAVGGFLQRLGC